MDEIQSRKPVDSDLRLKPWIRVLIVLGGWCLFGLFMAFQAYVAEEEPGRFIPWERILVREMLYALVWACFTPIVLWLARRYHIERRYLGACVTIHAIASVVLAVAHKGIFVILFNVYRHVVESQPFVWTNVPQSMFTFLDYGVLLYWMILIVEYVFDYYHQYREKDIQASKLEAQLAQAQLQALKMQLHPHFLFNTLNAISVLIQKDPGMARKTLGLLSDLLRLTLDRAGEQLVPLRTELDFLGRYLQIEQTRFGQRLTIEMKVDPDTLDAEVPSLLLQPLVENAIRHGVNEQRGQAVISIAARRHDGVLSLEVRDNGQGLAYDEKAEARNGIGLSNTRARLFQLYGKDHRFEVLNAQGGGVVAAVDIPYHLPKR